MRNLEIIGEASNKIPTLVRNKYPLIPWNEMYRMRNRAIHDYFGIDFEIIWEIITNNLDINLTQLKEMLQLESDSTI